QRLGRRQIVRGASPTCSAMASAVSPFRAPSLRSPSAASIAGVEMSGQRYVTGVILAGGRSRRMGGGDKGLLELAGKPMLTHVICRLRTQVDAIVINANGDPARFADFGLPVVADTAEGFVGPLAGVLSGMRWATANAPDARWIVTAAGDAPLLPHDLVERFIAAVEGRPNAIALAQSHGELHPVIGLWPIALAEDLEEQLKSGVRKV